MNDKQLEELGSNLDEMRIAGFTFTRNWNSYYQAGMRYIWGDQGVSDDLKEGWDPVVHNHIFPAVMQELAVLSQRRHMILARPVEESDAESAGFWQGHLQYLYKEELNTDMFLLKAALDGKVYGRYIAYNYWEPEAEWDDVEKRWKGAIRLRLVPPEYFAHDPETDDFGEAEYVVTRRRMPIDLAKYRWPRRADEIERAAITDGNIVDSASGGASVTGLSTLGIDGISDPGSAITDLNRLTNLLTQGRRQQATGFGISTDVKPKYVTVEQYFYKDRSVRSTGGMEHVSEEELEQNGVIVRDPSDFSGIWLDAKTRKPMTEKDWPRQSTKGKSEPANPNGRIVLRIGQLILNPDADEQRWAHRNWPFTVGLNHLLPHSTMGLNNVEMARSLQDRVNIGGMHLMNWMRTFADPWLIMEEGALVPGKKVANKAGAVIKVVRGFFDKLRRDPPPQLPSGIPIIMNQQTADLRDQTGVQEVGLGRSGAGSQTAREVIALQTNTRLRGALSNKLLDLFLKALWGRIAEQAARRYTVEDIVRVIGKDGAPTAVRITQGMLDAKFDIALEIGTSLPFDQEIEQQKALTLFQTVGLAYLPQLLKAFEVKDINKVLAAHAEYQAFLQFQQALEQEQAEAEKTGGTPTGQPQSEQASAELPAI